MDSRYVGDNHEPKSGQNRLVTKREIESEGDPLEGSRRLIFVASSVRFTYICIYMCVCVLRGRKKKKKEGKERKEKEKKKEKRGKKRN